MSPILQTMDFLLMSSQSNSEYRREHHRIYDVFPVFVRSQNAQGQRVKTRTLADNISEGGLFLQLPQSILKNTPIFSLIQLPNDAILAAKGEVVRIENEAHHLRGFGVSFNKTRLISL